MVGRADPNQTADDWGINYSPFVMNADNLPGGICIHKDNLNEPEPLPTPCDICGEDLPDFGGDEDEVYEGIVTVERHQKHWWDNEKDDFMSPDAKVAYFYHRECFEEKHGIRLPE